MTALRQDPAEVAINALMQAMREAFGPSSEQPPLGGGSSDVKFFAGDAIPLAAWSAHSDGNTDCSVPFLWVRLERRYRSKDFPAPWVGPAPCDVPVVYSLELGVGRCAVVDPEPSWKDYQDEAEISLDDSWRVQLAMCRAASLLRRTTATVLTAEDGVVPFGPEGGVIAWIGTMYVQL